MRRPPAGCTGRPPAPSDARRARARSTSQGRSTSSCRPTHSANTTDERRDEQGQEVVAERPGRPAARRARGRAAAARASQTSARWMSSAQNSRWSGLTSATVAAAQTVPTAPRARAVDRREHRPDAEPPAIAQASPARPRRARPTAGSPERDRRRSAPAGRPAEEDVGRVAGRVGDPEHVRARSASRPSRRTRSRAGACAGRRRARRARRPRPEARQRRPASGTRRTRLGLAQFVGLGRFVGRHQRMVSVPGRRPIGPRRAIVAPIGPRSDERTGRHLGGRHATPDRTAGRASFAAFAAPAIAAFREKTRREQDGRDTIDETDDELDVAAIFDSLELTSKSTAFRGGDVVVWYGGGSSTCARPRSIRMVPSCVSGRCSAVSRSRAVGLASRDSLPHAAGRGR